MKDERANPGENAVGKTSPEDQEPLFPDDPPVQDPSYPD